MLISIDPGKQGAYALFNLAGDLIKTTKVKVPSKQRFFTVAEMDSLAGELVTSTLNRDPCIAVMEGLLEHRMAHQSPKSTNTTAVNWGMQYAKCLQWEHPVSIIPPREWKKGMGLSGKDKSSSVELARQLVDPTFLRKERMRVDNVDIAEAILIGIYYGTKELGWEQYELPQQ